MRGPTNSENPAIFWFYRIAGFGAVIGAMLLGRNRSGSLGAGHHKWIYSVDDLSPTFRRIYDRITPRQQEWFKSQLPLSNAERAERVLTRIDRRNQIDAHRKSISDERFAAKQKAVDESARMAVANYQSAIDEFRLIRWVFVAYAKDRDQEMRFTQSLAWEAAAEIRLLYGLSGEKLVAALTARGFKPASVNAAEQWVTRAKKLLRQYYASENLIRHLRPRLMSNRFLTE